MRLKLSFLFFLFIASLGFATGAFYFHTTHQRKPAANSIASAPKFLEYINQGSFPLLSTPTPSPTPTPYPPPGWHCTTLPILMYHHIEPESSAKDKGQTALTVDPKFFQEQMDYLTEKKYTTMYLSQLADYFDTGTPLPHKPIILSFDDGYDDFYQYALPVLQAHSFKSEAFIPTGLLENAGYMSWSQIIAASKTGVDIAHHTWSHANVARSSTASFAQEIDLPITQFASHGFTPMNIFAYPYGTHNSVIENYLASKGFRIAVTTLPGQTQCKEDRLALHRTRIGNAPLSSYGI
ncbi:MAG TPA: polysaccharide deacetylase family protein [Patescibacteria group bacterium]|nr:polysaccharide deacetylase family protein [Patescibacteria group bacterium]